MLTPVSPQPPPGLFSGRALRRGLTLTETIIATALIALLAVFLLPTVQNTRENSRRVGCIANLRQISLDIGAHLADHDGYLPANASSATKTAWWYVLYEKNEFENFNRKMVCPSDPNPYVFKFRYKKNLLKTSYRYNVQMGVKNSLGVWKTEKRSLTLAKNASVVPLIVEINDPGEEHEISDTRSFNSGQADIIHNRHLNGRLSNVLFLDGHVGPLTARPVNRNGEWNWTPTY
ncbi:MAG TPA: prepilin-type N-terminal cleavage/methylation domain-containing protein [Chthoniobacteraceae bacterium]|nr:prepilin-type N-terminal cleavage/methylation domain-containing protein [Chthoniobacteraceae bacterium]